MRNETNEPGINPGVKRLVKALNDLGFRTCDSGDGATHDHECDRDYPYVVISTGVDGALLCGFSVAQAADQLYLVCRALGIELDGKGRTIQANYSPVDGRAFVELIGVTDEDIQGRNVAIALVQ